MADDDENHRLTEILVEEVSLVDRAANKRRFLITKKGRPMLVADGRGGFIEKADGDEDETDEAKKAREEEEAKAKAKADGESNSEDDDEDETDEAKKAREEEEAKAKAKADGESEEEEDEETTKSRVDKLTALATRVIEIAKMGKLPVTFETEINSMVSNIAKSSGSPLEKVQAELEQLRKSAGAPDPKIAKELASLREEVRKLKGEPAGTPNSRRSEGDRKKTSKGDADWPLDMNNPVLSREEAEKRNVSFYGD